MGSPLTCCAAPQSDRGGGLPWSGRLMCWTASGEQDSFSRKCEPGSAEHLALEHCDPVDVPVLVGKASGRRKIRLPRDRGRPEKAHWPTSARARLRSTFASLTARSSSATPSPRAIAAARRSPGRPPRPTSRSSKSTRTAPGAAARALEGTRRTVPVEPAVRAPAGEPSAPARLLRAQHSSRRS